MDVEAARARKRAAFIATLQRASQVDAPRARATQARAPAPRTAATSIVVAKATTVATVAAPAPPAPAPARPQLFRQQALEHSVALEEGRGVVRVSPPWTWALLWCVLAALGVALATSFVGRVEVTSRGRGILRPAKGVRALTAQLTGTVAQLDARSGDAVRAGATILRVDAPDVAGQVLEADRQLDAVKNRFSDVASQQDRHYGEQIEALKARAKRTGEQIASLRGSISFHQRRLAADQELLRKGLVSELAVAEGREAVSQAERQLSAAELGLDQTRQELASLEARRQDELWQRQQLVAGAQNRRDQVALAERQGVVVAPEDGTIEALQLKVGEAVHAGQVIAKLLPADSALHVVSFLAEKDRAFVKPGDEVELELDQLPHSEYGTLRARIARVGDDLASPPEVRDALGEEAKLAAPSYRVELEITDARAAEAAQVKLRTGALMNVRYTLRQQRLVTLLFNPLKRWFK